MFQKLIEHLIKYKSNFDLEEKTSFKKIYLEGNSEKLFYFMKNLSPLINISLPNNRLLLNRCRVCVNIYLKPPHSVNSDSDYWKQCFDV